MKRYPQIFEQIFSEDRTSSRTKLNLDEITLGDMELNEYVDLSRDFLNEVYSNLFTYTIKLSWLRRKFSYYGRKTTLPMNKNSLLSGLAFTKLLRRNVGKDIQIITKSKYFAKLETYFEELFPDLMDSNPFKYPNKFKFPFKYISADYLIVVYQVKDRIELLKIAEKEKMSFAVFLDFVINHVYCVNEALGRDKYQVRHNIDRDLPFYIRDTDVPLRPDHRNKKHAKA